MFLLATRNAINENQIADLRLASSKLSGAKRRSFQAEMSLKYCKGSARLTETVFGWKRKTVALGLAERANGVTCVGAQSAYCGRKSWEESHPEVAEALRELAESHSQQDPTFESAIAYTRLTSAAAIKELQKQGFSSTQIPAPSTMATILNRMGFRLRKIVKAKPKKNI